MNLPQTDFPMRAGLPVNEPKRLEKWARVDLYHQVLEQNRGNESYILHDGPPYANGPIHIGHAFNKVLKDIIVKYKSQCGFFSPYVPGWDCHGQPIEHMVETKLGPEKMAKINQPTLRRLCRDWARENIDLQCEGFKRLGVLGEWEDPYLTYTPSYEAGNVEIFKTMYEDGAIYRGRKPIHWCRHCHTALAEAEIEYSDESSPSIYVAFRLMEEEEAQAQATAASATAYTAGSITATSASTTAASATTSADEVTSVSSPGTVTAALSALAASPVPLYILIWTTTPWTLPANTAVALASDAEYVVVLVEGKALVMARELVESVAEIAGWLDYSLLEDKNGETLSLTGAQLAGLHYRHPIHETMTGVLITGDHVDLSTGTGAVHTAPGHGQEDYLVGEAYGLPMLMPVDDNGVFDAGGGPFEGLDVDSANPLIIDWLRERGTLIARVDITHSYPHCWRCHNPVIFRATDQWFVSMEATGLRAKAVAETGKLNWYPEWAAKRLRSMVEGRPDWCISRQRSWGVPIPVFKCARCSQTVATPQTFDAVASLFRREGADAWFTHEPAEYLPKGTRCEHCGSDELLPERDILDVWWESGVSHTSVLDNYADLHRPADLYLEGSDQHRGWFQSSLLTSVGAYGVAPYRGIMSCGFTVDENGEKMSKSKGNGVDPAEVIANYGADVLRLWVGSVDSAQDVSIGKNILDRTADAYRRFRNTFRFLLSNLYDFDASSGLVDWEELSAIDRWALARLQQVAHEVDGAYEGFRFHVAYHVLYDYVVTDLSAVYMDVLKDRLYSDAPTSLARRSAQTVLLNILEVLTRQLAPILSFTCDEVLEHFPEGLRYEGFPEAVALAGWPTDGDYAPAIPAEEAECVLSDFAVILGVRDAVTKALEEARAEKIVGKSQEARVDVVIAPLAAEILQRLPQGTLEELFIVCEVNLTVREGLSEPRVSVTKAIGEKCPRCWNIRELGVDAAHPAVCGRCAAVLTKQGVRETAVEVAEAVADEVTAAGVSAVASASAAGVDTMASADEVTAAGAGAAGRESTKS
jgi:isoleucyl-tRNA synthetase